MKVLLLNNVPAPYFDPLFEKLGRESGWRLTVCYSSAWNRDVGWEEKSFDERDAHRTIFLDRIKPSAASALAQILIRDRPDYLICYGYTLKPQITALLWAMLTKTPFAVIGDANIYCDKASGIKRALKTVWLRRVARCAAALIFIGTANRMFWESYGADPKKLFEARFAVDNDFFARASEKRKPEAIALRRKFGLDDKVVFLFVGRLVKRKNVDLIIRAAQQLDDDRVRVVIAGTGEELDSLRALAGEDSGVIFAGLVSPDELPLYYSMADALILPANQEPWGLVVNESMACGLAVIAHRHCGAAVDLVSAENGVVLEDFAVDEIARAMKLVSADDDLRRSMQERSQEKIESWSIDGAARGIIAAVESTAEARPTHSINPVLREEK
jgi:glycosyltransferase involved in cell wall biosynthesis